MANFAVRSTLIGIKFEIVGTFVNKSFSRNEKIATLTNSLVNEYYGKGF